MEQPLQNLLRKISICTTGAKHRLHFTGKASIPLVFEGETPTGSFMMVFTALSGVVLYGFEPGACSVLLFTTYGLAVYTTSKPGVKVWDVYNKALHRPVEERIELLRHALQVTPANDQMLFALGISLREMGEYAQSVNTLRALYERHPHHAQVEQELVAASRMLLLSINASKKNRPSAQG